MQSLNDNRSVQTRVPCLEHDAHTALAELLQVRIVLENFQGHANYLTSIRAWPYRSRHFQPGTDLNWDQYVSVQGSGNCNRAYLALLDAAILEICPPQSGKDILPLG